jgi:hypothetical protein
LAEIDKELLGKTEEVEELVDAETEELPYSKPLPVERESTDSKEYAHAHVEVASRKDRPAAQVEIDNPPAEALEMPAMPPPRFKRRQPADRGR